MKHSILLALVLAAAAAACGSKKPATTEPTGTGAGTGSAAASGWDAMSHEDKIKVMKTRVIPEVGAAMTAFDGTKFAKVECKTCHGKGADDGTFKMPNPDLPKLDGAWFGPTPPEDKKAMLEFMETKMKPMMAGIIGEEEFDPAHPEKGGFGCLNCHEMGGK